MQQETGRIVASFGRTVLVEDDAGEQLECAIFGRRLELVCADRVRFERDGSNRGIVHEVLPRRSFISRSNSRGESEAVAANATQLVVMLSHPPLPDFYLVDRYLAAAEAAQLPAIVVLNKSELDSDRMDECRAELAGWRALGYTTAEVSAHSGAGLDALGALLRDHTSLLVGQSGVGKSSLLNALVPLAAVETRKIVAKTGRGSHTTTRTALYRLPAGGELLDSPGVRDFAPGADLLRSAADGFREIVAVARGCRFTDCRHGEEPDCAVRDATAAGAISERRYRSYLQLRDLMDRLATRQRGY